MQTSKIKLGEIYAMQRGDNLVRFRCVEVVTRKSINGTASDFHGHVIEDRIDGERIVEIIVKPGDLLGPYEECAELVARKEREHAEQEAKRKADHKQAIADRLALYAFVGIQPPKDVESYQQLFRAKYGSVTIDKDGERAIIARIHALAEQKGHER